MPQKHDIGYQKRRHNDLYGERRLSKEERRAKRAKQQKPRLDTIDIDRRNGVFDN